MPDLDQDLPVAEICRAVTALTGTTPLFVTDEPMTDGDAAVAGVIPIGPGALMADPALASRRALVVVHLKSREKALISRLRSRLPAARIMSLRYEAIATALTGTLDCHDNAAALKVFYGIFCTPRSGSHFLCDLLTQNRMGRPAEHLREPLVRLMATRRFHPRAFIAAMAKRIAPDGILGTKIISHFLDEAFASPVALGRLARRLNRAGFRAIHLYRADKAQQAVSAFAAWRLDRFRLTRSEDVIDFQSNFPAYDQDALAWNHRYLIEQEEKLLDFLSRLDHVMTVNYEAIEADPLAVLPAIGGFLGISTDHPVYGPVVLKMRGAEAIAQAGRLCAERPDLERFWHPRSCASGAGQAPGSDPVGTPAMASISAREPVTKPKHWRTL